MDSNALLISTNLDLVQFYSINLEIFVGAKVKHAKSLEEVLALFNSLEKVDVLILHQKEMEESKLISLLEEQKKANKFSGKAIILGESKISLEGEGNVVNLQATSSLKEVIQGYAKLTGITAKDMALAPVPEFYPISKNYLKNLKSIPCDLYRAADEAASPDKMVKIEPPFSDVFNNNSIVSCFVPSKERLKFINAYNSYYLSEIMAKSGPDPEEQMVYADHLRVQLTEGLIQFGVTEASVVLAETGLKALNNIVSQHGKLNSLLQGMLKNKTGYLYRHSVLIVHFSDHMLKGLPWGTAEMKEKLTTMAFFHDILIKDDNLAQIHTNDDLKKMALSPEQEKTVLNHAYRAAEIISHFPNIPNGTDVLIRQHHGMTGGIGFTDKLKSNITPLAKVFIIAEDCADFLLSMPEHHLKKMEGAMIRKNLLQVLRNKYQSAQYNPIIKTLEAIEF